ncbi:RNA-binding S4 domain-containing protein [Heliobacterium gestii]|uniref:RQC P-site tRNA stabilizing factor n=1 Tax=Heliomicrobium gestii TaxID=2699 RepID=A0A845LH68_HELGE|nr:RNA-binding S4 domain-containing protein [Heliomicrobium gestii]MBM7866403.1 ribosomal 50S subunit-recycling heat shock protein [Heliomicrobium gestii]MZP42813.1 RNA-binding S4 domain-containing protein [Heliomicrobium gestii]
MRLDKYLKVSRIIKRRTLAKEVCDGGRVTVNGRPAKAGTEVSPGDRLVLQFPQKRIEVEIVDVKENARVDEAKELYRLLSEEALSRD